jgi:hypothetical protein
MDGWYPSNDVWVYASANSFTITGVDRTGVYSKGTRVKCTNNGSDFYGAVIDSSFSTDTTVTFAPNDDNGTTWTHSGGKGLGYLHGDYPI